MTAKIYIRCCAIAILLLVNLSNGQLIPNFFAPTYLSHGLNMYQQGPRLADAVNNMGLQFLPKLAPAGLSMVPLKPQLPIATRTQLSPLSSLGTLLLNPNLAGTHITPLQIRSTETKLDTDKDKPAQSIDPIDEKTDEIPKEVINSSPTNTDANISKNSHKTETRSPDINDGGDVFDYLSKAADPIDKLESKFDSMAKNIGDEFQHSMQKIDSNISPSHSHSNAKQSESGKEVPYQMWVNNSEDDKDNYYSNGNQGKSNSGHNFQYETPHNIVSDLKSTMDDFQQSLSDPQLMQKGQSFFQRNDASNNNDPNFVKNHDQARHQAHDFRYNPANNFWDKASQFTGNNQFNTNGGRHYPGHEKNWNPAAHMPGKMANRMNPGYYQYEQMFNPYASPYKNGYFPNNYPTGVNWNSGANLPQGFSDFNNGRGFYGGFNPSQAAAMSSAFSSAYPGLSRNYRQLPPINFGSLGGSAGGITQSALNLAQGIVQGRSDQILNSGLNLGTGIASTVNNGGQYGPRYFKRDSPFESLSNSATGLASSITSAVSNPGNFGNGQILNSAGSIWSAANNLAGNIGRAASNNNQFLGLSGVGDYIKKYNPIELPWNTATGLGRNVATNPVKTEDNKPAYSNVDDALYKPNTQIDTTWDDTNQLTDKIGKSALNPGNLQNNPVLGFANAPRALFNPATNLASSITRLATNPFNMGNTPLGYSPPIFNSAVDMAGKIVNTAVNPGLNTNSEMVSSFPTYAGGYFPRSNPSVPIFNSATQLASGIVNTAMNPALFGMGRMLRSPAANSYYTNIVPLGTVMSSQA